MAGMEGMAGMKGMSGMGKPALGLSGKPHSMPVSVFCGTSHCGAGCSLADLIVEWTLFALPSFAVVGGLHWLFPDSISYGALYAGWVIAYFVALATGITFQYFAIAPMNPQRSRPANIGAAAKADVLSLSAWQIGMYGGDGARAAGGLPRMVRRAGVGGHPRLLADHAAGHARRFLHRVPGELVADQQRGEGTDVSPAPGAVRAR